MRAIFAITLSLTVLMGTTSGCQKVIEQDIIVDNVIYGIDTIPVYASAADKDRIKTPTQYISTLYSHLYFRPISSQILADLSVLQLANGGKQLVNDLIIESFLLDDEVVSTLPNATEMRDDIDDFVEMTYLRFYLRYPTAYEKFGVIRMIEEDADITPLEVYRAFLLANEYYFY